MAALGLAPIWSDTPQADPARPAMPAPRSGADRALLEHLRRLARHAQLSAPLGLETTCSLIEPGSAVSYGTALMRALAVVASRSLVFHPHGAGEASFDELWLLRLLRCLESGDTDSARLLIGGRVGRIGRRTVTFLARGLAERIAELGLDAGSLEPF
jgi:hypothetical protein